MKFFYKLMVGAALLLAPYGRAQAAIIESFEDGNLSEYTAVNSFAGFALTNGAAHDGALGLSASSFNWIYRDDAAVTLSKGNQFSAWSGFVGAANDRSYFGFGASSAGTYSAVLAPNSGEFILQRNDDYDFLDLASTSQTYASNGYYRIGIDWQESGLITASLFDSDGTTLLNTVSAVDNTYSSGGIAFRGFGGEKRFDTIENFATTAPVPEPGTMSLMALGLTSLIGAARRKKQREKAGFDRLAVELDAI